METVCIPTDLTAFALSPPCCENKAGVSRISPITQPNYIGLQLDNSLIQHDVLDHLDLHLTAPAERNPRVSDLGTNPPSLRKNRLGVYLHWSLPRLYRSAVSSAEGYNGSAGNPQPQFRKVPNRWLVVRRLDLSTAKPKDKLPEYQSWVVESDVVRQIQNIDDSADLEVDMVPFVSDNVTPGNAPAQGAPDALQQQAEIFLGRKTPHVNWDPRRPFNQQKGWAEDRNAKTINLTVMNSSNPLFPDYVPHNSNVFSIVDNFAYQEATGDQSIQYLTEASASYFVLGWHSKDADSPLSDPSGTNGLLVDRLRSIFVALQTGPDNAPDVAAKKLLSQQGSCNVLTHGAVYNVSYNIDKKPPTQADQAAALFTDKTKIEPLSIGTTPLDGILTFLEAHNSSHMIDEEKLFGTGTSQVIDNIVDLASLLYAADDSYNSRIKAQDMSFQNNYSSSDGGSEWHFNGRASAGQAPLTPDPGQQKILDQLNEAQSKLDAAEQKLKNVRYDLFAEWWKYVSDRNRGQIPTIQQYQARIRPLKELILGKDGNPRTKGLEEIAISLRTLISGKSDDSKDPNALKNKVPCKQASKPPFFMRKDPTLCIAGLQSGFPADYMDALTVRVEHQVTPEGPALDNARKFIGQSSVALLQSTAKGAGERLLGEFFGRIAAKNSSTTKGHQQWGNVNPFHPLFIEWEAQYFHIDRKKWQISLRKYPVGQPHDELRYGLSSQLTQADQADSRIVNGRVILTPQPVFSLEAAVRAVLDSAGPNLPLTPEEKDKMTDKNSDLKKLKFISAPLSGLTDHLLTRYDGAHVKPSFRKQGNNVLDPMNIAVEASKAIDIQVPRIKPNGSKEFPTIVELIGSESSVTPYGNLINFGDGPVPFKSVTHGQMLFTKLNIIDRFGQAVCAIEPKPRPRVPPPNPPSVHPCLSDYLSPDFQRDPKDSSKLTNTLITVYKEADNAPGQWPLCRFIQLTPSINQNARINATFLSRGPPPGLKSPMWHETSDDQHESPVFGWLVLNYQDYGLQFFLPDGTFYRQVRVGGPKGTNASSKWMPFDPPKAGTPTGYKQLDQFIARMTTYKNNQDPNDTASRYLQGFFDMINKAIQNMPFPPSEYSAYANAIVGKPLALVNVGFSLELQAPPIKQQATLARQLPGNSNDPSLYPEAANLLSYKFPIKFGDVERPFDGMVGYYLHKPAPDGTTSEATTDWESLYTYFPSSGNPNTKKLNANTFPPLSPHYIHPDILTNANKNIVQERLSKYLVTTMVIDPYTPIHAYSPILPIKSLRLQPWTIQQAFSRMTAFFRLGPQLLSTDIPAFVNQPLEPDTWQTAANAKPPIGKDKGKAPPIRLPIAGKKGLWQWLQPYDVPKKGADPNTTDPGQKETKFVSMDVGEEDTRIRKDPAPYTFVEGYLQLARPLLKEDIRVDP